jgi:hypothetical protein
MRFSNGQNSTKATVYMANTTEVTACNNTSGWQGCAWLISATDAEWKMWIRKSETFCEEGLVNGCLCGERVAIHEMGHVGGYFPECDSCSQDNSVMQSATGAPRWHTVAQGGPGDGFDHFELQQCDQARMQIEYDVDTASGPYADCFNHVTNHGTFGMLTDLTLSSPTSVTVCSGSTVTATGRLQLHAGHYGRELGSPPNGTYHLDKNPLANRLVSISRNGSAYTSTLADATSGDNWSKALAATVSVTTTYSFVAQFVRADNTSTMRRGLDASPARSFSITWVRPTDC